MFDNTRIGGAKNLHEWCLASAKFISDKIEQVTSNRVQISLQLEWYSQASGRPTALNGLCRRQIYEENRECMCNASDLAMKDVLSKWIARYGKPDTALAYKCHAGMFNLIRRLQESHFHSIWYVFLGQFIATSCDKCSTSPCDIHKSLASIDVLGRGILSEDEGRYVQITDHLDELTEELKKDGCYVPIVELEACHMIAVYELERLLSAEIEWDKGTRMKGWLEADRLNAVSGWQSPQQLLNGVLANLDRIIDVLGIDASGKCDIAGTDIVSYKSTIREQAFRGPNYYECLSLALVLDRNVINREYAGLYTDQLFTVLGDDTARVDRAYDKMKSTLTVLRDTAEQHRNTVETMLEWLSRNDGKDAKSEIRLKNIHKSPGIYTFTMGSERDENMSANAISSYLEGIRQARNGGNDGR